MNQGKSRGHKRVPAWVNDENNVLLVCRSTSKHHQQFKPGIVRCPYEFASLGTGLGRYPGGSLGQFLSEAWVGGRNESQGPGQFGLFSCHTRSIQATEAASAGDTDADYSWHLLMSKECF